MDINQTINVLIKTDPFEMLDRETLANLSEKISVQSYTKNEYIFRQGEPGKDFLFIIASGLVEITVTNDRGVETVVAVRRTYDFFGETVVLSRQRYPASARARSNLVCLQVGRRDLERLIHSNLEFSGFFTALLTDRMHSLYMEIMNEQSSEGFCRIESPFFRKRVSEVMSTPVMTCPEGSLVRNAAELMADHKISALVVVDRNQRARGILSETQMVHHLIARPIADVATCTVDQVMNSKITAIGPEAFLGEALVTMMRNNTKHLIVEERSNLVGIVTLIDLIRTRTTGTLLLSHDIESQFSVDGLVKISKEIDTILNTLMAEKAAVKDIFEVMSELNERLTRRVIQLAEERMRREGMGRPPVEYCWINMGSAARYEQTLRSDQDNAIIYQDPPPGMEVMVDQYFEKLATIITQDLHICGFERCKGGVMATNPQWRRSLSSWEKEIYEWTRSSKSSDIVLLTILLDFRPVWGNNALSEQLWQHIFNAFGNSETAAHMLTREDIQYKLPINFLGSFVTEKSGPYKNQMDIKRAATVHIVNGTRLFAIKHQITEPSTFGRLRILTEQGVLNPEDADLFTTSFEVLMMFRIRENIRKVNSGLSPDNYINPDMLGRRERMMLKDALTGVSHLQKLIDKTFSSYWLRHMI